MAKIVRINVGNIKLYSELNDTNTAVKVYNALPFQGEGVLWGHELYFAMPIEVELASDAREVMAVGELAFWPPGNAFCIFFGPTPVSLSNEPRAASPVNPIGQILEGAEKLSEIKSNKEVLLEKTEFPL